MADIFINDDVSGEVWKLECKDETTLQALTESIGEGRLTKDGVLKANKSYVLIPGTYKWSAKVVAGQYPGGKLFCCFCILVFNCGFEYKNTPYSFVN
jgi:hypothetical protein